MDENILNKIYKSALKFSEPLTPDSTYKTIVDEAIKLVGGEQGSVVLDENGEFKKAYDSSREFFTSVPRKKGFAYKSFVTRKAIVVDSKDLIDSHPQLGDRRCAIFIPLSYKNKSIGVLVVRSSKEHAFSQKELDILNLFGSMASLAIRKTQLYDETRKALETRDLFISMAAHELRTPLTSVSGYVQLLQNKLSQQNTPEKRWADQLSYETQRLSTLVNELLAVNRIKNGEFNYFLKECSLKDIINRTIDNFKFAYPNRKIIYKEALKNYSDLITGDPDKLLQAFSKLLENAADYSQTTQPVNIELKARKDCFMVSVKDRGKGIPQKELPFIFERFYRGENTNKEGMGLGLYLVKEIIINHHGTIKVSSQMNKGTTFEIKLPKLKL
jgi:signal transduction histidine kinase